MLRCRKIFFNIYIFKCLLYLISCYLCQWKQPKCCKNIICWYQQNKAVLYIYILVWWFLYNNFMLSLPQYENDYCKCFLWIIINYIYIYVIYLLEFHFINHLLWLFVHHDSWLLFLFCFVLCKIAEMHYFFIIFMRFIYNFM